MGFCRQEYWSGFNFFLQEIFPTQGSKPHLLHCLHWQVGSLWPSILFHPEKKPLSFFSEQEVDWNERRNSEPASQNFLLTTLFLTVYSHPSIYIHIFWVVLQIPEPWGFCKWGYFTVYLVAQLVKNPPAMQETPVRFLGREDPLEKG